MKTRLSESQEEVEELNQSQSVGTFIVIGLSFRSGFRLRQSGIHSIISGTKRQSHKRSRQKTETFWFFRLRFRRAYDRLGFLQGHKGFTTPLTIPTPIQSLVKTSLFWLSWGCASLHIRQAWIYILYLKRYRYIRPCKLLFSISENSPRLSRSRIKDLKAVCRLMGKLSEKLTWS